MAAYIRRQIGRDEFTRWMVFVSAGTGGTMTVAESQLAAVRRSRLNRSSATRFMTKSILSPLDEAIDLDEGEFARAQQGTDRVLALSGKLPADGPVGPWIRAARGENPSRGLLILYPIDPADLEVPGATPAFGVVVNFPTSGTAVSERPLENSVRQREAS